MVPRPTIRDKKLINGKQDMGLKMLVLRKFCYLIDHILFQGLGRWNYGKKLLSVVLPPIGFKPDTSWLTLLNFII